MPVPRPDAPPRPTRPSDSHAAPSYIADREAVARAAITRRAQSAQSVRAEGGHAAPAGPGDPFSRSREHARLTIAKRDAAGVRSRRRGRLGGLVPVEVRQTLWMLEINGQRRSRRDRCRMHALPGRGPQRHTTLLLISTLGVPGVLLAGYLLYLPGPKRRPR